MLVMRRLYSKIPPKKLVFEQERGTKNRKSQKVLRYTMDNDNWCSYSKYRKWQNCFPANEDHTNHIKLLSYNILSQDLLMKHIYLYFDIDQALLKWEYRLSKLQEEVLSLKPDILCLQEMQYDHLKKFVEAIDGEDNFEYIYKKKTGTYTDGCAIIYDRRKFRLIDEYTVEYHRSPVGLLNRDNIAVIAKLCTKGDVSKTFLVATTHLLYNPKREDVRLAQINLLLTKLECLSLNADNTHRLPILLTGDFNFQPFSIPYEFVNTGTLHRNQLSDIKFETNNEKLSHDLKLTSAYDEYSASTFQNKWITVDYIFYSSQENKNNIKIWSVYNLPSKRMCYEMGRIPNRILGSDHLCVAVTFSVESSST